MAGFLKHYYQADNDTDGTDGSAAFDSQDRERRRAYEPTLRTKTKGWNA